MMTRERVLEVLEKTLRFGAADQTEVVIIGGDTYLTRYATNYIHQNTAESNAEVFVRSVFGKKIGVATTNALDDGSLQGAVRASEDIARVQPDIPDFVSLPSPEDAGGPVGDLVFGRSTAEFSPEDRAAAVGRVTGLAARHGFEAAGAFQTGVVRLAVGNSLGVRQYGETTRASLTAIVMGPSGSGYADGLSVEASTIDVDRVAETAVRKCRDAQEPVAVEPGDYEVILEPAAVADLVGFLGYLGLGALALQEGRSFASGRLGQKVTGEDFTLWDDGSDPAGLPFPFDFEGVRRRKVVLIESGVVKNVVYDSFTAGREAGRKSTGHALPPMYHYGPLPLNMFVKTGDATLEEMVKGTRRGLLVTRFHYTNPLHPVLTTITGMTRDGTFLIEEGRVKGPVKNLRFTNSILDALSEIEAVSSEARLSEMFGLGAISAPAMKLRKFTFTGATQF
ncbi:MAG: TldD/PmbA family protein [Bacillota bacterium]|jgi:predicted Zn-dependent protease